ncbi:NAD(P)-dependent oxidoreductase [Halonotius terrestris]|uniref:NAD(P)-dependent oxidoreductase n=1 Tax=Halonotius terrestris TaxID=2487750 RepID=A0A8J8PBJ2_9EURY|nr:NAD(P)-dependent oxidoreductase [Halonotius terrestris]TQQ81048.1 NAD(P)-dependent oxidoreductase [Halonotius terrestris]
MRVFITGATGVLGRRLVEQLTTHGHDVVGLVRDADGEAAVADRGGTPRYGDVLEPDSLDAAMDDGTEVVIHAATAIPASTKPSEEEWAHNDRVRTEGAKNVLSTLPDSVGHVLVPSVVWLARQPDGAAFDETAERHPDRATRSAAELEDLLLDRAAESTFEAAILRCGFFYAPDARDTLTWGKQLLEGDLPIVGGGLLGRRDAELSLVHAVDAARAFVAAIEQEATGSYHIVDDEPVTPATLFTAFAERLDAPEPGRIPGWLARFFIGKIAAETMTHPMPTTNEKATRELGWEPAYPTYREGLDQIIDQWERDGTLAELRSDTPVEAVPSVEPTVSTS